MATITSPGIGSGLDVNAIVSQLVALERAPIEKLQSTAKTIETKISAYGKIQSLVSGVRDAAAALGGSTLWGRTTGTSADATAVGVSTSGGAVAGSYSVQVNQLARAHSVASGAFADSSAVIGSGTLRIELGRWDAGNTTFTPGAAAAVDVTIAPGADSLAQIRDQINAANAGVTAVIVTDVSGARLALRSTASGAENQLRITASDAGGPLSNGVGLGQLAFNPPAGAGGLVQTQAGANALANINGLDIESASNQLEGVLDGVNLTLVRPTTTPIEVTVAPDGAAMKTAIETFVTAYNELNTYLASQTKYDEGAKKGATLQGDSAAISLRNQFRSLLGGTSEASTVFTRLSDIGFDVQRDGSIKLDTAKLDGALADLPEISRLFSASDPLYAPGDGFATRLRALADQLTGVDGLIASRNEGLQAQLERNEDDQDRLEDRVLLFQQRLLRQYTALDTQLGKMNGLSNYVSAQMAALAASGNSGS
ncbi:MAG TPA: flagellar filament capping protein FliD [Methylibium sp.]|nr:flagellar filament capping protein FliD [Methylibium sp.]